MASDAKGGRGRGDLVGAPSHSKGGVGWTRPEGIHLTLKFLGDIRESQIQPLQGVLTRAAAPARPFTLEARGLGVFPTARAPRVLWIGLHGGPEELAVLRRLQAEVEEGAAALGFQKEARPFTPHLTLARVRDRSAPGLDRLLEANRDRAVGTLTAASIGLIRSELRPAGPIYTTLVEVPFGVEYNRTLFETT